jgi:hypothetical protein
MIMKDSGQPPRRKPEVPGVDEGLVERRIVTDVFCQGVDDVLEQRVLRPGKRRKP